jgi:hypothetical protein
MMIARTELAFAYNEGAYRDIRQAQEQGTLGDMVKVWVTAGDDRVCPICEGVDSEQVNINAYFSNGIFIPPAHPHCRCGVEYKELALGSLEVSTNLLTNPVDGGIMPIGGENMDVMDITGASGAIPRNDYGRMDEHAARYYEEIRKRTTDVSAIAENTGFSVEDVESIKRHIFFNEYRLDSKRLRRFDPNYDMAVSWQRLADGKNIQEMDLVLLRHELHEFNLMKSGLSYDEAHILASKKFDYQAYTDALDRKAGL